MTNRVSGSITIDFSVVTDKETAQAAIDEIEAKLGDGLGICRIKMNFDCTDGSEMCVDIDQWGVEVHGVNEDFE